MPIFLKGHCHKTVYQKSILGDALGLKYEPLLYILKNLLINHFKATIF
jgi:hypothetical protein